MRRVGRLVSLTTATLVGLGLLGSPATAAYGDNFVQVQSDAAHRVVERSNVMVVANTTDTVDNGNLAEAYSHDCTGCRAVAVAFQVVLVPGSPSTVTPGNMASANNTRCDQCVAIAIAKQYLVYSHGARSIDRDAQRQVSRIATQVRDITTSGASYAEMNARLEPLYDRLVQVVRDGLVNESNERSSERSRAA
jgi:putative peptide zinc metalloprotease protein